MCCGITRTDEEKRAMGTEFVIAAATHGTPPERGVIEDNSITCHSSGVKNAEFCKSLFRLSSRLETSQFTEMPILARDAGFREVQHVSAATLAQRYFGQDRWTSSAK
jgi:hypothetical protein